MSARILIPGKTGGWNELREETESRELVYFDESLTGYVIFTKSSNEEINHSTLYTSLVDNSSAQEVPIKEMELNKVIAKSDTEVVYKFEMFTIFPKIKLKDPILKISLSSSLKSRDTRESSEIKEESLTSFQPATGANILEGFNFSVTSDFDKVILYDSLINKTELGKIEESSFIEISEVLEIPIIRTLNIRIRNIKLKNNTLITTLDIEHSSKSKLNLLQIDLLKIDFKNSHLFKPLFHNELPIEIKNGTYTFSYQLSQQDQNLIKKSQILIEITYKVNSTNTIITKLLTNIELIKTVSSSKQLSLMNSNNNLFSSLTIKYIGNKIVRIGIPFKLKVSILNHSLKDRNLLMIFNSNAIQNTVGYQPNLPKIKSLIQSSSSLLETYSNLRLKTLGVLSLVNEVQFKLKPSDTKDGQNVFQNEIELIALEIGVFNLQGVKLIDLTTGETLSCDRLLEIVVEP